MATKTLTVCDWDEHEPDEDVLADGSYTYPCGDTMYEIDLCAVCHPKYEAFLQLSARWQKCSRAVAKPRRPRAPRPAVESDNAGLRAWAREHGHTDLGERGRIPDEVRADYERWQASRNGNVPTL